MVQVVASDLFNLIFGIVRGIGFAVLASSYSGTILYNNFINSGAYAACSVNLILLFGLK